MSRHVENILEMADKHFNENNIPSVICLVVCGIWQLKEEAVKYINAKLKSIVKLATLSYGGMAGLKEGIAKTEDLLQAIEIDKCKKLLNASFVHLKDGDEEIVCLGHEEVVMALEDGATDTVLVWDESRHAKRLQALAHFHQTKIILVRRITTESDMLIKGFRGIAVINRYFYATLRLQKE